jgi:preprotein translocase subunit SecG
MLIAIYILTFFLVLNCLFLGLLILMQLPKKEAGLGGAAFGGGAVDALIGAGAGNVLTKATKWSAITFFVLIISLSLLHARNAEQDVNAVAAEIEQQQSAAPAAPVEIPTSGLLDLQSSTNAATPESPATTPTPTPEGQE